MGEFEGARIMNFAVGLPEKMVYGEGREMLTAIRKQTVAEAYLSTESFEGDGVADKKHHGGRDRAVCIYPFEHYSLWEEQFVQRLPASAFGENLTVTQMVEADVFIGDVFQIGEAVIQVTQGRVPCHTIDRRMDMAPLMKAMVKTGFTGYMCRVIEEGTIRRDSEIRLVERGKGEVSVLYANDVNFHQSRNAEAIRRVLEAEALAPEWQDWLEKKLVKLTE
ncbi:MOSC domain-containing protein [Planococcus sp. FY231025]|uniref:MOSC domain-containing protein n=1 Tax=Planococcus sp. FY231025 TaxID=3455699 RepID=UPI003F9130EB